ncbi:hypothetical protein [Sphaerisporangium album]|nr:hypothetical protein [Sphaerisporangium album]
MQNVLHKKHLRNRASAVIYAYETGLTKVGENNAALMRRTYPDDDRN